MAISVSDIQSLYSNTSTYLSEVNNKYKESVNYYKGRNLISRTGSLTNIEQAKQQADDAKKDKRDPIRKANNRVSSNFYQILVDQEAGYLATNDPSIDVGDDELNQKIKMVLGDSLALTMQNLIIDVSNAGVGWIHYWIDSNGNFKYGIVTPEQVYPIYADNLENEVVAVERVYQVLNTDPKSSKTYNTIIEYWDDTTCTSYVVDNNATFSPYNQFDIVDVSTNETSGVGNVFEHGLGRVPFIKFRKNMYEKPELDKVKGTIDVYDKVYNGFANDLQDIQQTLMVLKGYGGVNLDEFMDALRTYKAIKVDTDGDVDQLQIEIPVEARQTMLEITKQKIFDEGQGIDPDKFMDNGALSGKAIKGLYAHLDLKATTTEKNFRQGLGALIRAILRYLNVKDWETRNVSQTWIKNAIQDELERAQALQALGPYMSEWSIARANPFVDDVDAELEHLADEKINADGYSNQKAIDKAADGADE
ncbi:phage portal protein [Apilactobacillus sp. EABW-1NA]|uniref:phage portal protein n=1 Tax=Apilactobacillus sp. EABW-1NA TaxID=2984137 RepID=UPI0025B17982|nr:phage portal protein [Apilactobacillus sp. EABW-1NA]MDN2612997.1 phage portal protein [Apilactobacillus sp. EABW-1NA]